MEMIGATVLQKGTNNGIVTGLDGKFTLTLSNKAEQTLLISMIGFIEQSIAIKKNHPFINVTLEEDIAQLDEVVVVGYGTQKKVSLTGSISNVGTEDLKSMPVSSVTNALGGRIPGLVTRQESGRPGGDQATMFVRGRASLNDSSPLVLIDGVERPMAQIDPDDIETISVLKDASATAVYGVRGANGVVLVTTKHGTSDKMEVNVRANVKISYLTKLPEYLRAYDYAVLANEASAMRGAQPIYDDIELKAIQYHLDPDFYPDVNWQDEILKRTSLQQTYYASARGGGSIARYFVSMNRQSTSKTKTASTSRMCTTTLTECV